MMKKNQNTTSTTDKKQLVETKVNDPIVKKLDVIIELLSSIKGKVDSINETVPKPFDFSRLVKD